MAKKFLGFTPDQQYTILSKLGYEGPKDSQMMDAFVSSKPMAASKMGDYTRRAQELLDKPRMATGGVVPTAPVVAPLTTTQQTDVTTAGTQADTNPAAANLKLQSDLNKAQGEFAEIQKQLVANPTDSGLINAFSQAQTKLQGAQTAYGTVGIPSAGEAIGAAVQTPQNLVTQAQATPTAVSADQFLTQGTGQAGEASVVEVAKADTAAQATAPTKEDAAVIDTTVVGDKVKEELEGLQAATAEPSKAATVQGQLEGLMSQFEGGATPPWASGAMRQAMGIMQQRGLGASSIAGQAVVQAAMESAFAIASQDASTVAQFELQSLSNEQQTSIFKTQQLVSSMFTDQAAENASKQFNAASQNQVDQFFAGLQESVSRFNADQINGIAQFNAGQENSVEQFNSSMKAQRDQFNAQNSLIIEQANAQWRQNIATVDTAMINEANMTNAKNANAMTQAAMDQIWQREKDLMAFSFQSFENQLERDNSLILADKQNAAAQKQLNSEIDFKENQAKGAMIGNLVSKLFSW